MNRIRKFGAGALAFCLVLLFAFSGGGLVFAKASVPDPTTEFYVADYAGVLSEETKSEIVQKNDVLYQETGAQIVVATVDSLNGEEISDYAYDLFSAWGIGSAEKKQWVSSVAFHRG